MAKKWVYLGMLFVSLVGFVVDRLFLDSPKPAQAEETVRPRTPKPAVTAKKPQDLPAGLDPSLSWLARLADPGPGRDAFAPSPAWLSAQQEAADAQREDEAKKGPAPGSPEAFKTGHALQATTVMANGGLAVVDGRCLSVGDILDDYQLIRVAASEVEFQRDQNHVVLALPMSPETQVKRAGSTAAKTSASASASNPSPHKRNAAPADTAKAPPAQHQPPRPAPTWSLLRGLLGGSSRAK